MKLFDQKLWSENYMEAAEVHIKTKLLLKGQPAQMDEPTVGNVG